MSGTTSKQEILSAINDTLGEVQALLQKSGMPKPDGDAPRLKKDGPQLDPGGVEAMKHAFGKAEDPAHDEAAEHAAEGAEAEPEEGAPAPEGEEGAPAEGQEDPAAALAEQAKQLSDEELDHMLEVLMGEKEARSGAGQASEAEGAPEAAPAPAPEAAEKSMKSEFANLAKSMTGIADAVAQLTSEVSAMKSSQAAKPKVTAKPAAANVANAKVLQKSVEPKKRLAKSQTMTFLEGELRKRNPLVNSTLIAEANLLKSESELAEFQDRLSLEGLNFPEGK